MKKSMKKGLFKDVAKEMRSPVLAMNTAERLATINVSIAARANER